MIVQVWETQQTFSTECSIPRFLIPPSDSVPPALLNTLIFFQSDFLPAIPLFLLLEPVSFAPRALHHPRLSSIYLLEYNRHPQWRRNKEGEDASALRPHCLNIETKLNLHSPSHAPSQTMHVCLCVCMHTCVCLNIQCSHCTSSCFLLCECPFQVYPCGFVFCLRNWVDSHPLNPTLGGTHLAPCSDLLKNDSR